ncbi:MAG: DNA double-strand break repair nuclease NurA [Candidatus Bathyarchaeia archaeon]|nr:DNA double-strand break repair nuclease NurA [Candidatus Bathyarchaeota archaeon A05DMB-4]MDH7594623.1 DNA double-strand break repair nuclease NurA [Candidatus Bathyarchaeota archaeon]
MSQSTKKKSVLERLPPTFREQYFSLFAGPEPETIHPNLYQKLIDNGTDQILSQLKKINAQRKQLLRTVKDKIRVKQLAPDENLAKTTRIVASDASNNGVDLRSAFAPLYASTAIAVEGWKIVDEPVCKVGESALWSDEFRAKSRESLLTAKIQFEITTEAVVKWNPKYAVVDGTLLLNYGLLPFNSPSEAYNRDFNAALTSAINMLYACYKSSIPIVGFVKRTQRTTLCESFGAPQMRDTALLDLILRKGQYTLPEPEPMKGFVVESYKKKAETMQIPPQDIAKITNFYSVYIRTGLTTPYRLELPEFCLDRLEEIATILYKTSEEDGLPFAITEADHLTRITSNLSNIRTLMLYSKALDLVENGEMDAEDLNLLALQHGESWTIRDDRSFVSTALSKSES